MCGRYLRRSDKQRIAEAFRLGQLPEGFVLPPDFNIAPMTFQPVIRLNRETHERELVMMRWGFVHHGAASTKEAFKTINARAEGVLKQPMWRDAFRRHRCLVPADGFYEWQKSEAVVGKKKQTVRKPFAYTLEHGQPFAFAGLWSAWKDPANGEWLQTFAVITTTPNELTAEVHDRMPVILHPRDYDLWLQRGESNDPELTQRLFAMLKPYEAEAMQAAPANPAVGNVRNNGPEMLDACGPEEEPPKSDEEVNSK